MSLLLAITREQWGLVFVTVIFILLFVVRIRSTLNPFVEPLLFQNGRYAIGILLAFLVSALGFSIPFLTPIMLTDMYNLSPGFIGLVMVPASLTAAILGKQGGKIADKKGNTLLFILAACFLILAFILLSLMIGSSLILILITMTLIIGQVGHTFIVIAMSGTVAGSLAKEQAGVGMGLMSMLNFIASSISAAFISLVIDRGTQSSWNPLYLFGEGTIYSNLYLIFTVSYAGLILIYFIRFGNKARWSNS
ncbi:MFS transporter [Oceanobacillus jeddahense]|uniref:MFS transporter n=1 Tax=Oceanobacillus jeddahense TaxID=1462527 RepID=A0ABY5JMP8_9BACI|nr:MFS transporter [Oceanobacillus jeddahense]UUI01090.1 MFS transporter [Oceanobacillus jeddahense]